MSASFNLSCCSAGKLFFTFNFYYNITFNAFLTLTLHFIHILQLYKKNQNTNIIISIHRLKKKLFLMKMTWVWICRFCYLSVSCNVSAISMCFGLCEAQSSRLVWRQHRHQTQDESPVYLVRKQSKQHNIRMFCVVMLYQFEDCK